MKAIYMTALALAAVFAVPALADAPNRTTMTFEEFVNASGCVIVDKGGYSNLAAAEGGNCPFAVTQAWVGNYSRTVDPDGTPGTGDEYSVSDN